MKTDAKESIVQHFPHRCPYCDQPISYDPFELKTGENKIECPSCKKMFIKVVGDASIDRRDRRNEIA